MTLTKFWFTITWIIAILTSLASTLGLFDPSVYAKETHNWALQAKGQDMGNLISVIILLVSAFYSKKGGLRGFSVWLGSLFYLIYAYLIYAFAVHLNYLFFIYLLILGLSIFAVIINLINLNFSDIEKVFTHKKFPGAAYLLIAIGVLFAFLWISELLNALYNATVPVSLIETQLWTNPVHVIDLSFVLPAMVITGILLLKKQIWGQIFALPWLIFSLLMGTSIVITLILMALSGDESTLVPLIMVGTVVALSKLTSVHMIFSLGSKSNRTN